MMMLSGLVLCVLVLGAAAITPAVPPSFGYGKPLPSAKDPQPKPCCAPRAFTFTQTDTKSAIDYEGKMYVETIHIEGAYSAIDERYSIKLFEDFNNKTEKHLRLIADYKKDVSYFIIKSGETEVCFAGKTVGRFNQECVPDDATYVGEATLGDHDLLLNSWYFAEDDGARHIVKTVQQEECVPVSLFIREFNSQTGEEESVSSSSLYDFNLGICDPEEYFKPPASCDEDRALAEPPVEMLKMAPRKGLFY